VIFDVQARGAHEVLVSSLSVGGMLGPCSVFACNQPWCGDDDSQRVASGWGHSYSVCDEANWKLVAREIVAPSWDVAREIVLDGARPFPVE
jgi:hypothetical protein